MKKFGFKKFICTNYHFLIVVIALLMLHGVFGEDAQAARLKDISNIRGVRENQLIGYGLVVGLAGTGDGAAEFTSKSMARMLDIVGVKLDEKQVTSKNVAAVMITASLPAFARSGNKLDVTVHAIGDASSLSGGTLIQTPLRAANKEVYAVAQGALIIGSAGNGGKAHTTVGSVPSGAIIEKDLDMEFAGRKMLRLTLHNPDFTTAARVSHVINRDTGGKYAVAKDSATIDLVVPPNYDGNAVEFMAAIESLDVNPDARAKVVINEKTGTVVIGEMVKISKIAIAHGNISVQIGDEKGKGANAAKVANTAVFGGEASVGDIVNALNGLGISPKDLITILQNIKAAGALHGDLEVL
ncbi:MAG: flagellar basal body P-ring protein FlgI [Bdellovibrionota bacterium]